MGGLLLTGGRGGVVVEFGVLHSFFCCPAAAVVGPVTNVHSWLINGSPSYTYCTSFA